MMEERPNSQEAQRLAAEVRLADAHHRLHMLRVAALSGGEYDPDEFDQAVVAFRRAWQEAQQFVPRSLRDSDERTDTQTQRRVA